MNILKNIKIQTKLLFSYFLVCIIPLILVSQVIYHYSVKSLESTLLEMMAIFNSQIVSNINNFINEYDNITKAILVDQDIVMQGNLSSKIPITSQIDNQLAVRKILLRLNTLKPDIDRVILYTNDGELFQYGKTSDSVHTELLKNQTWFQEVILSQKTLSITPLHDTSYYYQDKNRTILTVSRIILDKGGKYSGTLLIDLNSINLIELNEEFLKARNNYNITLSVTNKAGEILYHSDMLNTDMPLKDFINNDFKIPDKDSNDFIVMSESASNGDLIVHTVISRKDLRSEITQIYYITMISTFIISLITILISIFFSYSITKPIKRLQKSMKLAEDGKYLPISEPYLNDEMKTLIISYNQMIAKTKALIEEVYLAEIKQKNARLLALQTQINPHMLYNTLESIRMNAFVNGDKQTAEMIKILARLFRFSLEQESSKNTIQNELHYLEDYVRLQNIRFDNRFKLKIQLNDEIKDSSIITLILQPLIENSIKHGTIGSSFLDISIDVRLIEENNILVTVSDNGNGMSKETIEKLNTIFSNHENITKNIPYEESSYKSSIGLKNISERIYLYYGCGYYIKILPNVDVGTSIELKVPNQKLESTGDK